MSSALERHLDELIASFNRRLLDVPDGFFDRGARFTLNGRTYESLLGRTDDDPLIRLIARGAAGYRFAAKPLLHALDTALVSRISCEMATDGANAVLALRGTLRGSGGVLDEPVYLDLELGPTGAVRCAHVRIGEDALRRIQDARAS